MNKPKVSIIMLTYNREKLVSRAIESIINQTFQDFEFIIINNGSTDDSGVIADEFAKKYDKIKVIHKEKGNIGSGRNVGLNLAEGDFVAFIDDDDYCETDFIEFLYNLAAENNADVSICGATDKDYNIQKIMKPEQAIIELMWRKLYNMAFPTKMFSKKLADKIRFPEDGAYDDIALMYRLLALADKVAYNGKAKYTFYRHENNNSAWTTNHKLLTQDILNEYLTAYRKRTEWLSELFPDSADTFAYFEWSFMISMIEKIERLNLYDCNEEKQNMKLELIKNKDDFLQNDNILPFEKKWMEEYVLNN